MFNIRQANFKSAHLLNKMALIQFQSNRTVFSRIITTNLTRDKADLAWTKFL